MKQRISFLPCGRLFRSELVKVAMFILTITKSCRIVKEHQSNVDYVFRIWWNWYTPCKGCTWYNQVFNPRLNNKVFNLFHRGDVRVMKSGCELKNSTKRSWYLLSKTLQIPSALLAWWSDTTSYISSFVSENFRKFVSCKNSPSETEYQPEYSLINIILSNKRSKTWATTSW